MSMPQQGTARDLYPSFLNCRGVVFNVLSTFLYVLPLHVTCPTCAFDFILELTVEELACWIKQYTLRSVLPRNFLRSRIIIHDDRLKDNVLRVCISKRIFVSVSAFCTHTKTIKSKCKFQLLFFRQNGKGGGVKHELPKLRI
jgi:hypothetical protein